MQRPTAPTPLFLLRRQDSKTVAHAIGSLYQRRQGPSPLAADAVSYTTFGYPLSMRVSHGLSCPNRGFSELLTTVACSGFRAPCAKRPSAA